MPQDWPPALAIRSHMAAPQENRFIRGWGEVYVRPMAAPQERKFIRGWGEVNVRTLEVPPGMKELEAQGCKQILSCWWCHRFFLGKDEQDKHREQCTYAKNGNRADPVSERWQ